MKTTPVPNAASRPIFLRVPRADPEEASHAHLAQVGPASMVARATASLFSSPHRAVGRRCSCCFFRVGLAFVAELPLFPSGMHCDGCSHRRRSPRPAAVTSPQRALSREGGFGTVM